MLILLLLSLLFLIGTFFSTAVISAFRRIRKPDSKKQIKALGKPFFYKYFHSHIFPDQEYEGLFFATICAQNLTRFCFTSFATLFFVNTLFFQSIMDGGNENKILWLWVFLSAMVGIFLSFLLGDYLPRIWGTRFPERTLKICAPGASFFMILAFPMTAIILIVSRFFSKSVYFDQSQEPTAQAKQELIDLIQEASLSSSLEIHDKKLIESVLTFKERIAREVMVPRVDMFSLAADTTIREASKLLQEEGYSRIPIYKNTVDNIVGVLMYKDVLIKYIEYDQTGKDSSILDSPIETIQKNILYTPETKKISSLLQEFRKKQVHVAIVVDEYGGTEGIVTIEDILEEIVGDISDEYDEEETLYKAFPDGSWIVDARMSIFDIDEELGIQIPQEGEYDTIGGYIFHCTGSIPTQGFVIHHNEFEIEVLRSNDRSLKKVRIKTLTPVSREYSEENKDKKNI